VISITGLSCKNRPPFVPAVLSGPTFSFTDTTCTFRTTATDPDGDSVSVRIMWTDLAVSDWSDWFASGDTVVLTHAWPNGGIYKVSAQARDVKLNTSGWSDTLMVQVIARYPPGIPLVPIGPEIGGQDTSYAFSTVALHPAGITVAVRFTWGDGATSDWSSFVASGETVAMNHSWSAPGTYGVSAQAKDTGDVMSQWSTTHTVVVQPPVLKWRFRMQDSADLCYSSPAIGPDGTIYVGSPDGALYAVNPDGTLRWRYLTGGIVRSAPAIADDGTIYAGSQDSLVYAINPDGVLKWTCKTSSYVRSSPAIAGDGTIYIGSSDHRLYALNPDGTLRWRYLTGGSITSSPAIAADGTVYFGSWDDYFYAVNPDSTLKWRFDAGGNVESSPAIAADGTIYVGAAHHSTANFHALNPDGTPRWSYMTGDDITSSPVISADGTVYVGSHDDFLYAFSADGTPEWTYQTAGRIKFASAALVSDGTVYFGSQDDRFYALHPDGTLRWCFRTGGNIYSAPAIGPDGTIYVTSSDGYLYALKGTSPLADSPWPKFHHDLRNAGRVGGGR
jgi:outer membrane protein assembly factor BamB